MYVYACDHKMEEEEEEKNWRRHYYSHTQTTILSTNGNDIPLSFHIPIY